ncbi:MAG: glycosyltransferase family 2 protein [Halopenitus sp.]
MIRRYLQSAGTRARSAAERIGVASGAFGLLAIGFWQGLQVTTVTVVLWVVSLKLLYLKAVGSFVVFTTFLLCSGALLLWEVSRSRDPKTYRHDGPPVDALIPVFRDGAVVERSVESLLDSDYENLRIRVVTEPGDTETIRAAESLAADEPTVEVWENDRPGSKSGAINSAVARSDADHFVVFDADEVVAPSFVPAAMGRLTDGVDVFQGRRVPEPTGLVETLAYCERALFHASYQLVELTGFTNCRSSSTAFTRDALESVGGYQDCLTEDLAFAHAAFRHGLDVEQHRNHVNTMEAPHTLRDLWGQRKRWRTGQVEYLHRVLSGKASGGDPKRRLLSFGRIATSLLGSLLTLTLVSKFLVLFLADAASLYLAPLALLGLLVGGLLWVDVADGVADSSATTWVGAIAAAPVVIPLFGLLTLSALFGYTLTWDGEWFRVAKTSG